MVEEKPVGILPESFRCRPAIHPLGALVPINQPISHQVTNHDGILRFVEQRSLFADFCFRQFSFGDLRLQSGRPLANSGFERSVEFLQLFLGFGQLAIFLNRRLVRREEKIENLQSVRADKKLLAREKNFDAHSSAFSFAQMTIGQQETDACQQVFILIGFEDQVVSAAFQTPHDIGRVIQRSQKNDWYRFELWVLFDLATKLIAVHFRHDNVADDQRGRMGADGGQRLVAVASGGNAIALLLDDVAKPRGLSRAVLDNENMDATRISSRAVHCKFFEQFHRRESGRLK
ncbi:MAG TPA: hypothetical protein VFW05_10120 [Verrucomicrobiae bacterium]|nr:hypothetical protein [Verrucomicrobiae bacterium]